MAAVALYATTTVRAQTWSWATESGTGTEYGNSVATDNAGNNYVAGDYTGPSTFGSYTLTAHGNGDAFLAKYNSSGAAVWAVKMAGTLYDYATDVTVDSGTNILVAGTYRGTITFYSTDGVTTTSLSGGSSTDNIYLAKYNSSGIVQWAITVSGNADCGDLNLVTSSQRVYISGQKSGHLFAACYNYPLSTAPSPIWTMSCTGTSGTNSKAWAITGDGAGNSYLLSTYSGTITGTLSTGATFSGVDGMLLMKLSSVGAVTWSVNIGSGAAGAEHGRGIRWNPSGHLYIGGHYTGTASIAGSSLSSAGSSDVFVAKYTDAGVAVWARKLGGVGNDNLRGFTMNSAGDTYLFTQSVDNNSVAFGCKTYPAVFGNTDNKMILAKYNSGGIVKGSAALTLNNGSSYPGGVSLDASGNTILTGHKVGAFSAGPYTLSTGIDMFLTKVAIADELPTVASTDVNLCGLGASTTLSATGPSGSTIKWYNSALTLLTTGGSYTTPAAVAYSSVVYYVSSTVAGCESAKLPVTVTTHSYNTISVTPANSTICNGSCVTVNFTNATTARLMPGNVIKTSPFVICPSSTTNYTLTNNAGGYCETPGTFSVNVIVTSPFAGTYSAKISNQSGCTPALTGPSKPICTTPVITDPMPNSTTLSTFKCQIGNSVGWQGAGSVGINDVSFVTSYTVEVYEVDNAGVRKVIGSNVAPSVFIKYGVDPSVDDFSFNDGGWGASFDSLAPPFYSDLSADGDGNNGQGEFFKKFYLHCKRSNVAARFTDYSSRVFCVDMRQVTPEGCTINKKSFFSIANNGATSNGHLARFGDTGTTEEENSADMYNSLEIYPNPTNSLVYIPLAADDKNVQVIITDNLGKQVMRINQLESHNGELNMTNLPAGIYFYNILKNNTTYKGKIVKQ